MASGFSIIIPTYNRADLLGKALRSVQALRVPAGWQAEVLVIDNNSTDETRAVAQKSASMGPIEVRYLAEKKQGLNHGRNRGLQDARHEHLIYLDDDMTVSAEWLEGYAEVLNELHPDCVVGPVEPKFEEPPPEWLSPQMLRSVTSAYSRKGDKTLIVDDAHAHELPGCNFAVWKAVAMEVGGFHPALDRSGSGMLAGGDWEFGERIVRLGRRVAYSPRCRIRHLVSRKKLSREGLRQRWEGSGATTGALMRLRGERVAFPRRLRLLVRMGRFYGRAFRFRWSGDSTEAFQWELHAVWLKGFLLKVPPGLQEPASCQSDSG